MYLNQAHPLTQTETAAVLWLLVALIGIVGALIVAFWNQVTGKLKSVDDNVNILLVNSHGYEKDIEALEKASDRVEEKVGYLDNRVLALERGK